MMTNYERIKAMSVEEIADILDNPVDWAFKPCRPEYCEAYITIHECDAGAGSPTCHRAALNWLNAPAEE